VALNAIPFFCDLDPVDLALLGHFIALSTFYDLVDTCSVARPSCSGFSPFIFSFFLNLIKASSNRSFPFVEVQETNLSFAPQYHHAILDTLRALTSRKLYKSIHPGIPFSHTSFDQTTNEHRSTKFRALWAAGQERICQAGQTNAGCWRASRTNLTTPADETSACPQGYLPSNAMASS
jgi:hypothetical protein